jgi:hypothetical protein
MVNKRPVTINAQNFENVMERQDTVFPSTLTWRLMQQCFPILLLTVNTKLISDTGTFRILYIWLENVKTRNKLQAAINYTCTIL